MGPFACRSQEDHLFGKNLENSKQMRLLWYWDYLTKQLHSTGCKFTSLLCIYRALTDVFRRGADWLQFLKQFVTGAETITGQQLVVTSQADLTDPSLSNRHVDLLQDELEKLTLEVSICDLPCC